ncbi:hypothetical protein J2T57_004451 [Natronocella acetinitrilica]|uniref:DUF2306 domain-containing protein n=1 Tax=Natronocella acetinitrilica TaxID=414046 RepID=A0AAE3KIC8_9GAMM|nr:DUF2306 domain-containing protein [Natronocella acetinitrilica]MCP1677272.1 hypothetical protein [Natronocella acetinitrilica]
MSAIEHSREQSRLTGLNVIRIGITVLLVGVLAWLALRFWLGDALPYLLNQNEDVFGRFWPHRAALVLHIVGGTVALFMGPFQFWSGLRRRSLTVHRWTGRLYIGGVLLSSTAGFFLAPANYLGLSFGAGLIALNFAWLLSIGMAYAAIRLREITVHRDWMIRSYVLTFSFVTFRFLFELPAVRALGTPAEVGGAAIWVSWVIPLLLTEVVIQGRALQSRRATPGRGGDVSQV